MTVRKIQLVRHGATRLNNNDISVDRIRGWKDIPLSEDGRKEAKRLGEKMQEEPPDFIVSSDLERTLETAAIISSKTKAPLKIVTKDFRPWNVGDYAGKLSKDVAPILADYAENHPTKAIPGGESFNAFRKRFFGGLAEVLDNKEGVPAIVTHHRGERLLHAWLKAGCPPDDSLDIREFNKKGEHTGAVMHLDLPIQKVKAAARALGAKG